MPIPTSQSEVSETVYVLQYKFLEQAWLNYITHPDFKSIAQDYEDLAKFENIYMKPEWRIIKRTTIEQPLTVEEQTV
jgi:hypothetical protein